MTYREISVPLVLGAVLAATSLAYIAHLATIPTTIVSFKVVLIGDNLGEPSGSGAIRLAQLLDGRFSPLGADPPRRQPLGLLV